MSNTAHEPIPAEFKKFVHGIEINEHTYIKLVFNSVAVIKKCANYFFERAVLRPEIAPKFAEYAAKVYFIAPENEDINFRKALIAESQIQLDIFMERLNSAGNQMTPEHAIGVITFYGELYNVGFIFKGIVKKYLEIFESSKNDCFISNRCFYTLAKTVKKRVVVMAEEDYGVVIQALLKKIDEAERNPTTMHETNKTPETPRTFEELFPPLSDSPPMRESDGNSMTLDEKIDLFKFYLEDLDEDNAQDILKRINDSKKIKFDDDTWEIFYEIMIQHGIENPHLGEAIVDLCQRIPRAWQGVKMEDCKSFIIQLISLKIKQLFEMKPTQVDIYGVLNMLQKFMDQSFYSIGSIASTVDVILINSQQVLPLAARILMQLFAITKKYVNAKKIQKLPEKVRKQVVQIMKSNQNRKLPPRGQAVLIELEEYLGIEIEYEEEPGPSKTFNEPLISNGREFHETSNSSRLNFDPVIGRRTPDIKPNGFMSSPKSSPVPQEVEVFDYARFIDDQLSINDPNMMKKSIQIASKNVRSWDLTKLAKTVFDKSVAQGDHEKFVTFSIVVNHEVAFKQTLTSIAINALENELLNPNPALNKTANSIAEFVCELFKIDWISNNLIHRCIGLIASDQFESLKRIKILHTLIKPIAMKIKKIPNDDSLIFYSKKIQSKTVSITDYESHLLCTEAAKILEIIATQNDDSAMHFKPPSHIDMITIILNSFTDYLVCANRIKTMNVSETVDLNFLVDTIISKTMANTEQVENFAKLVMELSDIPVIAPNGSVNLFKVLLVSKCQNKYLATFACTQIDPLIVQSIFALTRFIAYLYMLDVVNEDFLIPCIEVLFRNERSCSNTVFCINILFQTIGKKIENKNKHFLTRYYTIFESVVNNEESARSFIYSKLIELRNNKWIEGSSKAKLTIELKDFGDCKKMETVIESMKRHLKTSNIVRQFIAAVLNFSLVDHKSIQNCAQFFINFQEITLESDVTFNEILNRSVQSELEKFNRKQTLNRDEKKLFASLLTLTGELYREDIVSDEDLHTCLLARQVNQISLDELAHLSLIISPKIQQKGSKHLKTVLGMLENIIHDVTMDVCMEIKTDLIDLTDVMQSCQEHNVHQTNT